MRRHTYITMQNVGQRGALNMPPLAALFNLIRPKAKDPALILL
jgi:hypothetical protein